MEVGFIIARDDLIQNLSGTTTLDPDSGFFWLCVNLLNSTRLICNPNYFVLDIWNIAGIARGGQNTIAHCDASHIESRVPMKYGS